MLKLLILSLLSMPIFAADNDGFNPQIFRSHKWSSYDICSEAMFMMTMGIRNEYNIKRIIHNNEKSVWQIYIGRTLELTCRADGYYTGYFKDNTTKGTYTNPSRRYDIPEHIDPKTPDIKLPEDYKIL